MCVVVWFVGFLFVFLQRSFGFFFVRCEHFFFLPFLEVVLRGVIVTVSERKSSIATRCRHVPLGPREGNVTKQNKKTKKEQQGKEGRNVRVSVVVAAVAGATDSEQWST